MKRLREDPFKVQKESRIPKDIEYVWNLITKSEAVKKSPIEGKYVCADYVLEVKNFLEEEHIFSTIAIVSSPNHEHIHAIIAVPSYVRKEWFFFNWNANPYTLAELMEIWDELIILMPEVNDKKFLGYPPSQKHIWYQYPPGLLKVPLRETAIVHFQHFRSFILLNLLFVEYKTRKKFKGFSQSFQKFMRSKDLSLCKK